MTAISIERAFYRSTCPGQVKLTTLTLGGTILASFVPTPVNRLVGKPPEPKESSALLRTLSPQRSVGGDFLKEA
jgi:hypothetical protein